MTFRITARSGIAALAVAGIAAVTACSSSSTSSSPAPSATSASAASSSSGSNPLSGGTSSGSVVVGSANFPENEVLAEVYALALQKAGVKATTKLNIGAREIYYPQVQKGAITIIPEYNGTLLSVEVDKTSTIEVRDYGKGIDPKLLDAGRDGHLGPPGMRERAEQIGAQLDIWSELGAGTEVDLRIPGSVAYGTEGGAR